MHAGRRRPGHQHGRPAVCAQRVRTVQRRGGRRVGCNGPALARLGHTGPSMTRWPVYDTLARL
jgi:hypothetical protein